MAQLVEAADRADIATLAVTEHLPLPPGIDPEFECSMDPATVDAYRDEVLAAREAHPNMEVLLGGELDWLSWLDCNMESRAKACEGLEYVLGSVHFIDGWAFDDPACVDEWQGEGKADYAWTRYLEIWGDLAQSGLAIDALSHPDLVKKFGIYPSFDLREWYLEAARIAAASGLMVEVNTSGWQKDVGEAYPAIDLLREFCAAGVDCTVGTDAHRPADVAFGIERGYDLLRSAGYERLAVPTRDHDRRYIEL